MISSHPVSASIKTLMSLYVVWGVTATCDVQTLSAVAIFLFQGCRHHDDMSAATLRGCGQVWGFTTTYWCFSDKKRELLIFFNLSSCWNTPFFLYIYIKDARCLKCSQVQNNFLPLALHFRGPQKIVKKTNIQETRPVIRGSDAPVHL